MRFGSLGIGSAWLFGIALLAAPHRIALLAAAALFLVGAGAVLIRHRRAIACTRGGTCALRAATPPVLSVVTLGAALAIAGYLFA